MKMAESSTNGLENSVGKGEIAHYEQFLLFPSVFKRLEMQTRKNQGLFEKGLKAFADPKIKLELSLNATQHPHKCFDRN